MRPSGTSLELGSPAGANGWTRWVVAAAGRLLVASVLLASPGALGADYLADLPDLPLMAGLVERAEGRLVFDKPEGRSEERRAAGPLARAAVGAFYAATLAELGWRPSGDGAYKREGEALRITVSGEDGAVTVHFSLTPD